MKKILSLDLGITSIGYAVMKEEQPQRYSLVDYGVLMFDSPFVDDKKRTSKKLLHSAALSSKKLTTLKKKRKQALAQLFEDFKLHSSSKLLENEKSNLYKNKWELRASQAFSRKLEVDELFTILYMIAKHRGYKSLSSEDLLDELCDKLGIEYAHKNSKADEERGKIKSALQNVEQLRSHYPDKTVAQIIYEIESKNPTPIFRNHDNYRYMIKREYINDEIAKIILSQEKFGLFPKDFNTQEFIRRVTETIDDQKESTNDLSLFGDCEFYPEYKVAHQYSIVSDIYKMYQALSNITFNNEKITREQIQKLEKWFFKQIEKGKNLQAIKYKDIRKVLQLDENTKIFNKEDFYIQKGKKVDHTIVRFHFLPYLSKIGHSFIVDALASDDGLKTLADIFETVHKEKSPKRVYEQLQKFAIEPETIINLIRYKNGSTLNISSHAMLRFIPYFKEGIDLHGIKEKLQLDRSEDYSRFPKGIRYLQIAQYEKDTQTINNHPVKSIVSAALRVIKHLHAKYGAFDEIRVESTRELSLNEKARNEIEKANKENEKKIQEVLQNEEYQHAAKKYGINLNRYARKIVMWESQERLDIYSGDTINIDDIFTDKVDVDHIVPRSLGGLSVKHNLVLVHRDSNMQKNNTLPLDFVSDKEEFRNRVEYLFSQQKINWKKRKNLLAESLDDVYKDTFESKSLRATSYVEALTAKLLKHYYPFPDKRKQKDGSAVRYIQGRATANMRKLLGIKSKSRQNNIHHAVDAILVGLTNHAWLQKLSNTFRENYGIIDDEARQKIAKNLPYIDGLEPKEIVKTIEQNYLGFGEDSVFYKDIWGNIKVIYFWVSKKPETSKIHKDTVYSKKEGEIFTARESIIEKFTALKITPKTSPEEFMKKFNKEILHKMYLYKTNPNDAIVKIVQKRAETIKKELKAYTALDLNDKEVLSEAKQNLDTLLHSDLIDYNGNVIRKVKFYQTNLKGLDVRGGRVVSEKTFIGFQTQKGEKGIEYKRIDAGNIKMIEQQNSDGLRAYKNDVVFFVFDNKPYRGGKIVSFLEEDKKAAFSNPKRPFKISCQ